MPSGVEHLKDHGHVPIPRIVTSAPMPSGVEHLGVQSLGYSLRRVTSAPMPSGVEHGQSEQRSAVYLCHFRADAFGR